MFLLLCLPLPTLSACTHPRGLSFIHRLSVTCVGHVSLIYDSSKAFLPHSRLYNQLLIWYLIAPLGCPIGILYLECLILWYSWSSHCSQLHLLLPCLDCSGPNTAASFTHLCLLNPSPVSLEICWVSLQSFLELPLLTVSSFLSWAPPLLTWDTHQPLTGSLLPFLPSCLWVDPVQQPEWSLWICLEQTPSAQSKSQTPCSGLLCLWFFPPASLALHPAISLHLPPSQQPWPLFYLTHQGHSCLRVFATAVSSAC